MLHPEPQSHPACWAGNAGTDCALLSNCPGSSNNASNSTVGVVYRANHLPTVSHLFPAARSCSAHYLCIGSAPRKYAVQSLELVVMFPSIPDGLRKHTSTSCEASKRRIINFTRFPTDLHEYSSPLAHFFWMVSSDRLDPTQLRATVAQMPAAPPPAVRCILERICS